jgi:hypothetical protein
VEQKRKQARSRTRKRIRTKVLDDRPRDAKRARVSSPSQPTATRALSEGTQAGEEDSEGAEGHEREDWGAEACVEVSTSDESDSQRRQSRRLVRAGDVSDAEDEATRHDASDVHAMHKGDTEASGDQPVPTKAPRKARRQHRREDGWSLHRRVLRMQEVLGDSLGAEFRQHEDDTELNTSICCACLAGPHEVRVSAQRSSTRALLIHAPDFSFLSGGRAQRPIALAVAGGAVSHGRWLGTTGAVRAWALSS